MAGRQVVVERGWDVVLDLSPSRLDARLAVRSNNVSLLAPLDDAESLIAADVPRVGDRRAVLSVDPKQKSPSVVSTLQPTEPTSNERDSPSTERDASTTRRELFERLDTLEPDLEPRRKIDQLVLLHARQDGP